jgi:hypothetical protein
MTIIKPKPRFEAAINAYESAWEVWDSAPMRDGIARWSRVSVAVNDGTHDRFTKEEAEILVGLLENKFGKTVSTDKLKKFRQDVCDEFEAYEGLGPIPDDETLLGWVREAHLFSGDAFELSAKNAELRAQIERWSDVQIGIYEYDHKKMEWIDTCLSCRLPWPCPTEVAKGWKT